MPKTPYKIILSQDTTSGIWRLQTQRKKIFFGGWVNDGEPETVPNMPHSYDLDGLFNALNTQSKQDKYSPHGMSIEKTTEPPPGIVIRITANSKEEAIRIAKDLIQETIKNLIANEQPTIPVPKPN